jgi:hypothetical protein
MEMNDLAEQNWTYEMVSAVFDPHCFIETV